MNVILECGHAANAIDGEGKPSCAICCGIVPGHSTPMKEQPDLTDRLCQCCYCKREVPSSNALAFFEYRPSKSFDLDYCGCRGWD